MKKLIFGVLSSLFIFWLFSLTSTGSVLKWDETAEAAATATSTVTLSGTVTTYLNLVWTSGQTITFPLISPGSDSCPGSGSILAVSTNAANGYTVGLHDVAGSNSAMRHTDTTTYIPDMVTGSFATPIPWVTGTTSGLGVTMFAADTTKEAGWGTGTTPCVYENAWAAVPATATTAHTAAGAKAGADSSSWGWKVNVINSQKTGMYTGNVTFTVTAVFS